MEIKKQLLRQFATEIIVRRSLYGKAAIIQSNLSCFATPLPHSTIFAVLEFFGMPRFWITFFSLRMVGKHAASNRRVRIQKRGVPMTHALEKFFGEVVLFPMDFVINQKPVYSYIGSTMIYGFMAIQTTAHMLERPCRTLQTL